MRFLKDLPDNVTDIMVAKSNIGILRFDSIPLHFTNLISITFDDCNIHYIKLNTHPQFMDVRNISIINNHIDIIRENTFGQFPKVEYIDFSNNSVEKVYEDAFSDLLYLRLVNLSHNNIEDIQPESFPQLEDLVIDLWPNDNLQSFPYSDASDIDSPPVTNLIITINRESRLPYILLIITLPMCITIMAIYTCLVDNQLQHHLRYFRHIYQRHIGQITIGRQMGDTVWEGILKDGQKVAIKKYYKASSHQFSKELDILLRMSRVQPNPHIVRYICKEEDPDHLYVALDLCDKNLEKAVKSKESEVHSKLTVSSCLHQITDGLKHIHKQGIQHRDIKPKNILMKERQGDVYFVISDFDLGHYEKDTSEHKKPYGTKGWAAPELWSGGERTTAVDVFSLGCVFYYVLSKGYHPFAPIDNLEICQQAICDDTKEPDLQKLTVEGESGESSFKVILARDLIASMLRHEHKKRPKARWVLQHPLFWSDARISKFYHNIGKWAVDKHHGTFQRMLRTNSNEVFTGKWTTYLDEVVARNVDKKFDTPDICKLLRTIRNKAEHFEESSEELKRIFYGSSTGVARYFNEKFPRLLLYTFHTKEKYDTVQRQTSQ